MWEAVALNLREGEGKHSPLDHLGECPCQHPRAWVPLPTGRCHKKSLRLTQATGGEDLTWGGGQGVGRNLSPQTWRRDLAWGRAQGPLGGAQWPRHSRGSLRGQQKGLSASLGPEGPPREEEAQDELE